MRVMIVRGGTGFREALRVILLRNWPAVGLVLLVELGAFGVHELIPGLEASVFSASAVGVLAALGLSRWLTSMLYETAPTSPAIFAATSAALLAAAGAACLVPAMRATRVDPIVALRDE